MRSRYHQVGPFRQLDADSLVPLFHGWVKILYRTPAGRRTCFPASPLGVGSTVPAVWRCERCGLRDILPLSVGSSAATTATVEAAFSHAEHKMRAAMRRLAIWLLGRIGYAWPLDPASIRDDRLLELVAAQSVRETRLYRGGFRGSCLHGAVFGYIRNLRQR